MHKDIQNENEVVETSFENQENVEVPATQFEDSGEAGAGDSSESGTESGAGGEGGAPTVPPTGETTPADPSVDGDDDEGEEDGDDSDVEESFEDVVLTDTDKAIAAELPADYAPDGETTLEALVNDGATNVPKSILQNAKNDEEKKKDEDKEEKSDSENSENNTEDEEKEDDEKKKKFSLEEELEDLRTQFAALEAENAELRAFKQKVENEDKDNLIASFYMLSDEDKKEVIENKAQYSLEDIEAKLSVICVRKKVNFNLDDASVNEDESSVTFNLNSHEADNIPAWLKAVEEVQKHNK